MSSRTMIKGVFGPGSFVDTQFTPLPVESYRLLRHFAQVTPGFTKDSAALSDVEFYGDDLPLVPGPLKSQAMSAVLHAMIGIVGKEINALKGIDSGRISIDVDKAGLYPATAAMVTIDGKGIAEVKEDGTLLKVGVNLDHGVLDKTSMYTRCWAIYPTRYSHIWYQVMGNLDAPGFLAAYGLDSERETTRDAAYEIIKAEISKYSARELDLKNMEHGFCGQTCYSPEHWRNTEMGKRLAAHPLINYRQVKTSEHLPPVPFPSLADKRPLAGIKVLELARIIAAPATGAALAALGADVIKVQSPHLKDLQPLSVTLTAGKRTFPIDLTIESDRQKLWDLIEDCDVVLQAFRLRSLERKGFGLEDVLAMANRRRKGIVYVDLNCYGPDGYYAERPGFQQTADAASGCSYVCGRAYGFNEGIGVLPPLPIADMLSGAVATVEILLALRDRAKFGGSYHATAALTAIDAVQVEEVVGLYPPQVVMKIQDVWGFEPMTPDLHVEELMYILANSWTKKDILTRKEYWATYKTAWGDAHSILSPVVRYENSEASPRWSHGPVPYISSAGPMAWS